MSKDKCLTRLWGITSFLINLLLIICRQMGIHSWHSRYLKADMKATFDAFSMRMFAERFLIRTWYNFLFFSLNIAFNFFFINFKFDILVWLLISLSSASGALICFNFEFVLRQKNPTVFAFHVQKLGLILIIHTWILEFPLTVHYIIFNKPESFTFL